MEFEILKTGKFVNSNGKEISFSDEDLQNIANNYDPATSEAPLVIGHPKTNDPAFGWIDSLKVQGDKLIATATKIVPEFLEAVKQGLYKKRSVSLNPDNTLRHVGFLGAALPAVKGLADLAFSDSPEENIIEFSDAEDEEEFHLSDALAQITALSEKINSFSNEFNEWKKLRISIDGEEQTQEKPFSNDFASKVSEAFAEGKLTVPMKEKLLSLLTMDFSENAKDKFSLENFFTDFISSLPIIISKDDFATPAEGERGLKINKCYDFSQYTLDAEAEEVHKKIIAVVDEKNIPYTEAAQIVFNS